VGNIDRREKTVCCVHVWEVIHDAVGKISLNANVDIRLQGDHLRAKPVPAAGTMISVTHPVSTCCGIS
jgi:hypothetical protein